MPERILIGNEGNEIVNLQSKETDFIINNDLVDDPDHVLRKNVVDIIMPVFKWANISVIGIVAFGIMTDIFLLIRIGDTYQRIVDGKVIMSLVGATTIQLGVLAVTIGGYLFPNRNSSGSRRGALARGTASRDSAR